MKHIKKVVCAVSVIVALITGGVVHQGDKAVGNVVIDGQSLGSLSVSQEGLLLIANAEGCRQDPYRCPADLLTNGIGNTVKVTGKIITQQQVAKDFVRNVQAAEQCINQLAPTTPNQGQYDAFVSFVFNTGCTRFQRNRDGTSTTIGKLVKQGNYAAACRELPRWVYGGGKKLRGLITRRGHEYDRCMAVD
ncbi:lysozyme [Photobacterium phosphoreum]|uniref:lysozyme n=1 Tax=Photobacterium phosphoreum TaxID=659 RepID=UPI000D168870|nr:lysozyme [Photobacterium phosphoreum]PSU76978.1 lysozyme [Photobacterium phosphoreum]